MNKETKEKLKEIFNAIMNGDVVEYQDEDGKWVELEVSNEINHLENYRIKQKPCYRSFTGKDECIEEMRKHVPFGYIYSKFSVIDDDNEKGDAHCILEITKDNIITNREIIDYDDAFLYYTFLDGTPFGICLN